MILLSSKKVILHLQSRNFNLIKIFSKNTVSKVLLLEQVLNLKPRDMVRSKSRMKYRLTSDLDKEWYSLSHPVIQKVDQSNIWRNYISKKLCHADNTNRDVVRVYHLLNKKRLEMRISKNTCLKKKLLAIIEWLSN